MYILGIETSCDETSCAVLENYKVLSNVTISSLKEHRKYGGVIPEIATRSHLKNIDIVFNAAFKKAKIEIKDIDLISVVCKPGLIGALVVGVNFAKGLSFSLNKPLIGVNHLYSHLFSPFLNYENPIELPLLGLVVSGGHTEIYLIYDFDCLEIMGETTDDACGEVFDKVSRSLGLGYPGGPVIDRLYNPSYKNAFKFRCGRIELDLSFSGIKTALIYKKNELEKKEPLDRVTKIKLISSFQESIINALVDTVMEAIKKSGINKVLCGGGVMANGYLRIRLKEKEKEGISFLISPLRFCGDNAAMAAGLGFYLYKNKKIKSELTLTASAN